MNTIKNKTGITKSKTGIVAECPNHVFDIDPWEPGVRRCIYCDALFEDVIPLKLPPHRERTEGLNSTLVRILRHYPYFPKFAKKASYGSD